MRRSVLGAAALLLLVVSVATRAGEPEPPFPAPPGRYVGTRTCDGMSCHSRSQPRKEPPAMRELEVWSGTNAEGVPNDRHSVAWRRLKDKLPATEGVATSKDMMAALAAIEGGGTAPEKSERCLRCHGVASAAGVAVGPKLDLHGSNFRNDEGVTCDACHGPGEKRLSPHPRPGWALARWKESGGSSRLYGEWGLYYSKDLELWANQCARCHVALDANLIEAGHPDLVPFELFGHNQQVAHWRDYSKAAPAEGLPAAGPFHSAAAWQSGQVAAVRFAALELASQARGVHIAAVTSARLGLARDRVREHQVVLAPAAARVAPEAAQAIEGEVAAIGSLLAAETLDKEAVAAAAERIAAAATSLSRTLAAAPDLEHVRAVLRGLVAADPFSPRAAEQLARAVWALRHAELHAAGAADKATADLPTDEVLVAAAALLENSAEPGSEAFGAALAKLRELLGR